jgi:hypothetical protein
MRTAAALVLATGLVFATSAARADESGLNAMTGCWESEGFNYTSLLKSASDGKSNEMVTEKMWLRFDVIPETDYLVLGHIYEWDEAGTYVLGPTYENGAYNPALKHLTFGFPEGGLDTVTQPDPDHLLYVHTKAADLSAMSVRMLKRITCEEAEEIEKALLEKQAKLKQ